MTTGPPAWSAWLLNALVPRRHREVLAGDVLDRYRDQILPARGRARANRWLLARVAERAWTESRPALIVVVLAFLLGDGLYASLPENGATARVWLNATGPVCALAALGVRAGWRSGIPAAVITGFLASCFGSAAILALTVVSLTIAQPQLMKIGLSWESLRDVTSILRTASLTGAVASLAGGLAGTLVARPTRRVSGARR